MIVCICKRVSDHQIRAAVESGCQSLQAVSRELGVGTQCGKCACHARELVSETLGSPPAGMALVGQFVPQPA